MDVGRVAEGLQVSGDRDLATEQVVADVEAVQARRGQPERDGTNDPVVAEVQGAQPLGEFHFGEVECEPVPRQVDEVGRLVFAKERRGVALEQVVG